ncbi:MAG: 3'-5' exonuclease domain-containing protein 2 [Bacteroidales bacterium]|nr:3'-5' exonuclease domain-containing protein 2 [Bacteroidales bacterium]MDD3989272.1 3'-5' exonuclease domain-containing protein 2 [Bacteroidales bacterium]MDD4639663.1 3'-5' exonuclease domain-containing protein 2 [Bacteroidales bacterium]
MPYLQTISSEDIEKLPQAQFRGEIHVISSEDREYQDAIEYLSRQRIIGFDTETKPVFQANSRRNSVALLQLSGRDKAYIFRLLSLGVTDKLSEILSSKRIIKVGAAVHDDIKGLQYYTKFTARGFVDLQAIALNWGIKEKSVRKMAAIILGMRISKSQQLSNWEADYLTTAQIQYAAIDAWVCQRMYLRLLSTPKEETPASVE